jgi:catechol 2,3-dioxygenase
MNTPIKPQLTHAGINCFDLAKMREFYVEVLGLTQTDTGTSKRLGIDLVFLSSNPANHHQIVLASGRSPQSPVSTINQLSFKLSSLAELKALHKRLIERKVNALTPVSHGNAWSVYFEDPEGNTVELYLDTPWYVPQPFGDPLDLELSDEEIARRTEQRCRAVPGFMTDEEWRRKTEERISSKR